MGQHAKGRIHKQQILDFIVQFQAAHRASPTLDEIRAYMGFKSVGSLLTAHIRKLEQTGWLERTAGMSRSIQLTKPGQRYYDGAIPPELYRPPYQAEPQERSA